MGVFNYRMKVIMYELYASNFLILLRNCFRTAAFFYPWNSVANDQEWPVWVFEYVPMLINSCLMNIYPPAKYLPANHKFYLAVDGKTEIEGPGLIDKRPFLITVVVRHASRQSASRGTLIMDRIRSTLAESSQRKIKRIDIG